MLSSQKLPLFQILSEETALPAPPLGSPSVQCALLIGHSLSSSKPYFRFKKFGMRAVSVGLNLQQNHLFVSEGIAPTFHLRVAFLKLSLSFPHRPTIETGLDLFALAHEVDMGQRIQCQAEAPQGATLFLEFELQELQQPAGLLNEPDSDADEEEEELEGSRVEYLLSKVRIMLKFGPAPAVAIIPEKAPAPPLANPAPVPAAVAFSKPRLRLADSSSEEEDEEDADDVPSPKLKLSSKVQSDRDLSPLKKSPPTGLQGLKKFHTEVPSYPQKPAVTLKLAERSEPLTDFLPKMPGQQLSALPKFTSWAGVQNLNEPSRDQNSSSNMLPVQPNFYQQQATPYFMPQNYQPPASYMGGPGYMPPPPGLVGQRSSLVETSQGMSFVPYALSMLDTLLESDKGKKGLKKKGLEKQKVVSYWGELLTLTMGADAKETQVTEFEMRLFASPEEIVPVEGKIVLLAKSYSGSKALQGFLSKGQGETMAKAIAESTAGICGLMTDKYGNYYC